MNRIRKTVLLFFVYFLIAVPFKVMEIIPGFTDIRPVTMLGPIYAVFFGIPGCIIMAVGNLVMDILSNSLRWSSIAGFVANFAGPFLFYLFWICWNLLEFVVVGKDFGYLVAHGLEGYLDFSSERRSEALAVCPAVSKH